MTRGVLICILLALAAPARADDVVAYEAEGDAAAAGADPRVAALDDAFARAVANAVGDLVAGDARTAHKGELDREIIGHARLWVKGFTVTRDETNDDRRQLSVSVRIDRDKLRTRLAELGITTSAAAAPNAGDPAAAVRQIVILERVATPQGTHLTWGAVADKDVPGLAALTAALRSAGYAVRRAPASGPSAHDGDLPISDDEADALASDAKADLALVAGITVGPSTPARGQPKPVALVTAHLRLVDHKKPVGEGSALAAALGEDPGYAIDRALAGALSDVLPPAPRKLAAAAGYQGDDSPVGEPGIVLVRMPTKTTWRLVMEEQRYLAGARGVRAATLRRMSPRGWVIGVSTGESLERIAQIAKRAPTTDSTASVKIVGEIVELSLAGSTP